MRGRCKLKRILDCRASDFKKMTKQELKQAILASEGRTILAETVVTSQPYFPEVSNPEMMKAFGADLILLNMFDVFRPKVNGMQVKHMFEEQNEQESFDENVIKHLKELIGLPVGINLEPVSQDAETLESLFVLSEGRTATKRTLEKAKELGCDFVCLTGNPKSGVTNEKIEEAIKLAKEHFGGLIIAGKMHSSGTYGEILDIEAYSRFVEAGADIILMPAPGTVPGIREDMLAEAMEMVKKQGALTLAAIGTSQEGADEATVRTIALSAKRAGADVFHIGDAGVSGMSIPENIQAMSIAVRGKRHTYIRMAASPLR